MLKVYKEHKVNPFGGCLPMLLPMPVLLALFFVFANTIELRGVPFLWLPDLSQRDPFFIIPGVMGAWMGALTKLGQAGMPPNPQMKMMVTVMPIMMTVLFVNFASGLNLYYAVSNLVSLPQQWMINKARQGGRRCRAAGFRRPARASSRPLSPRARSATPRRRAIPGALRHTRGPVGSSSARCARGSARARPVRRAPRAGRGWRAAPPA